MNEPRSTMQPAEKAVTASTAWEPPPGMHREVASAWRAFYGSIRRDFGVAPKLYRALYLAQSGRCYVCRIAKGIHPDDPKGYGNRRLGVDHNHAIGGGKIEAVRALVCTGSLSANTCNRLIARYDVGQLQRAIDVLAGAPAQRLFTSLPTIPDGQLTGWLTR